MDEIKILQMLDHPQIIQIVEVFRCQNKMYIVMEKCNGGELFDRLVEQPGSRYNESYTRTLASGTYPVVTPSFVP